MRQMHIDICTEQHWHGMLEITAIIVLGFIIMNASTALQRIYIQMMQGYLSPFSFRYSKTWGRPKGNQSTKLQTQWSTRQLTRRWGYMH